MQHAAPPPPEAPPPPRFSATLTKVLLVQVVTLALLWLAQSVYHR